MDRDNMDEKYPSNSLVRGPTEKPGAERLVSKVTKGRVSKKRKNLGGKIIETFLATDLESVGNHLWFDVMVPMAKEAWIDMWDMLLNGDRRGDRIRRDKGRSYVYTSYDRYYDNRNRRGDDRRREEERPRSRNIVDELIFDTRPDAEEVLSNMIHLIEDYGVASVRDLYGYAGMTSDYTKEKYGWFNLDGAHIDRVRDGFLLRLPRPVVLD